MMDDNTKKRLEYATPVTRLKILSHHVVTITDHTKSA